MAKKKPPPPDAIPKLRKFVEYAATLRGNEKSEAQVFCDRLFQAFGHEGYKEAGATLESKVKRKGRGPGFIDLLWAPRMLLEMKSRGEKLEDHYGQAFEYWVKAVPHRPRYVVLCNFDEFWIYDFDEQLDEPKDRIRVDELTERFTALNFLFPDEREPLFNNNRVAVTTAAATQVAKVFRALVKRGEDRSRAQRFILQCVVAMFAEDIDLLPRAVFSELLRDCANGESSYDLLRGLFEQMNSKTPARGGRFVGVPYFNGGLFDKVEGIELTPDELLLLIQASDESWAKVQPAIFGSLFQATLEDPERHKDGAHFTSEAEILKVVHPCIVRPWQERIEAAKTLKELMALRAELVAYTVLDPACGSGNFLYVAYRSLKRIEMDLIAKINAEYVRSIDKKVGTTSFVSTRQFFGIDTNSFAVELAKVTLMLAKKLALDEALARSVAISEKTHQSGRQVQVDLPLTPEAALPLDNLDENIKADDALFCEWPKASVIIGNPPYQSKNKMAPELGESYVRRVRARYPEVPGRANYCVYWFRRAHDEIADGAYAGLIGTNQIKSNYSREGGLDYITNNGGTIVEAVSSQVWPGDAQVHVSIVNWLKGSYDRKKKLYRQLGDHIDSPWEAEDVPHISSSLSADIDVASAKPLDANKKSEICFQGQTHGHEGFLLEPKEAAKLQAMRDVRDVIHPYLTGADLLRHGAPTRFVIDLNRCSDVTSAMKYKAAFEHLKREVMPEMKRKVDEEKKKGIENGDRAKHFERWWRHWRGRLDMLEKISALTRYVVCVRHTKRPVFAFVDPVIHPNDALTLFAVEDDYSFGVLQSDIHWRWFQARCSPMKREWRYTSETVWDSFPWPQDVGAASVKKVAKAAVELRRVREKLMEHHGWTLRELYRTLETPGRSALLDVHEDLASAVREAYGMSEDENPLSYLLQLNMNLSEREASGQAITGPGFPLDEKARPSFVTTDRMLAPQ